MLSFVCNKPVNGREPWSSGYGRRLVFWRSWVRIPAPWTVWTFFTFSWTPVILSPENTHLLCNRKYHCTADLLFDWLGFSCFACVELERDLQVWSNPNQSNRWAVQWNFPLWSNWVFSALSYGETSSINSNLFSWNFQPELFRDVRRTKSCASTRWRRTGCEGSESLVRRNPAISI